MKLLRLQFCSGFQFFILVTLLLGIGFRFFHLDYKLYWQDEVYSTMRAAGFTRAEIKREIFNNRLVFASDLQKYQRPKLDSTPIDTINALAIEDSKHPPLFFLLAHFWMRWFGSSMAASRMLPVLISLLSLPLMYGLAMELFASVKIARLAVVLLAVSPVDILFAQTARQYSLLTAVVIGSSWLFCRTVKSPTWQNWVGYGLACTVGLYTHLFFVLTAIAHSVYLFLLRFGINKDRKERESRISFRFFAQYGSAIALPFLLYLPWLWVLFQNAQPTLETASWTQKEVGFIYLLKLWILSFSSLFFDLDFGFDNFWNYALRSLFILLILVALYTVCQQAKSTAWLFILATFLVPFLLLGFPDLVLGGKRSAVTRYLVCSFPAIQLAVAYFLSQKLSRDRLWWRGIFALLITGSLLSCAVSAFSETWWNKGASYFNAETAKLINATNLPILISEKSENFIHRGDLISLSYLLEEDVRILLVSEASVLEKSPPTALETNPSLFLFRPTKKLRMLMKSQYGQLEQLLPGGELWQVWK